jgi:hypothetical protein
VVVTPRLQDAFFLANFVFSAATQNLIPLGASTLPVSPAATRFLLLRDGAVYFQGSEGEFVQNPDPYLRKFLS